MDAEGDNIAITSQSDLDIISLGQSPSASIRILITEAEEEKPIHDRSFEELDDVEVVSVKAEEQKAEVKAEPQVDIAAMIQSRIAEIIPEITKKVTEDVTTSMIKSTTSSRISAEEAKKPSSQVVHEGVTCDSCGKYPIVGIRYKCSICHNYDFCEECEARGDHPHAFLKIRTPAQAPKVLIASLEGDAEGLEVNGKFLDAGFFKNIIDTYAPKIPEFVEKFKKCAKRHRKCHDKSEDKSEEKVVPPPVIPQDEDTLFSIPEMPKKEEPKKEPEVKKPEPKVDLKREQEVQDEENRQIAVAYELEQILQVDFFKMLQFVKKNPKLSLDQLVEKYLA